MKISQEEIDALPTYSVDEDGLEYVMHPELEGLIVLRHPLTEEQKKLKRIRAAANADSDLVAARDKWLKEQEDKNK